MIPQPDRYLTDSYSFIQPRRRCRGNRGAVHCIRESRLTSRRHCRRQPLRYCVVLELAQGSAGDEMTLKGEGVVEGGMRGGGRLSWHGPLETLHLALPSPDRP